MATTGRGVDFITIDGGEGGTGAAPLVFTDSCRLPFKLGFSRVYAMFAERGLHEQVVFIGSGKLGLPDNALVAFALGCDMVNVGARGDAGDRLHPGAEVPHRPLPDRRRHPEHVADARARPDAASRCARPTTCGLLDVATCLTCSADHAAVGPTGGSTPPSGSGDTARWSSSGRTRGCSGSTASGCATSGGRTCSRALMACALLGRRFLAPAIGHAF